MRAEIPRPPGRLVVFAYGSLAWNPGFPVARRLRARLRGWHRRPCIWSHHHRGTPERPGLVLGLCRGGACVGLALEAPAGHEDAVCAYLAEREMRGEAYEPRLLRVDTPEGILPALTFVARQPAPALAPEEAARIVAAAHGASGPNVVYLRETWRALREIGVDDPHLARLMPHLPEEPSAGGTQDAGAPTV
jgi:cation transport protein ChaC